MISKKEKITSGCQENLKFLLISDFHRLRWIQECYMTINNKYEYITRGKKKEQIYRKER